ncbi:hypothetical protein VNO80_04863 [Phaseolus coccineus]|uniref:Uncharacterized protein n=1 Tax=Phaseolus coccineus TaxID=3886 RepID=A0AAN9NZH7_PHACN
MLKAAAMGKPHRHRLVVAVVRKSATAFRHGAAITEKKVCQEELTFVASAIARMVVAMGIVKPHTIHPVLEVLVARFNTKLSVKSIVWSKKQRWCCTLAGTPIGKLSVVLVKWQFTKGGALKPVNSSVEGAGSAPFVHLFFSVWMPEVYLDYLTKMEPVMNVGEIKETQKKLVCSVCKAKCGACVRCSHVLLKVTNFVWLLPFSLCAGCLGYCPCLAISFKYLFPLSIFLLVMDLGSESHLSSFS